jgi:hypothetical protein
MLSASLKESFTEVAFSVISNNVSLGITNKVSQFLFNSSTPSLALIFLFGPSKANGLVTTPTVKAPHSFVILAIAGAAPVPVPPPIPAVINTISQPSRALTKTSRFSSTA